MSRIATPAPEDAPEASQTTLSAIAAKLGRVPNFFRVLSNSPSALDAHSALSQVLGKALDAKTRERIALAVAAVNGCEYCDAAHTFTGFNFAKLSREEIDLARKGSSADARAAAAAHFARTVAEARGKVAQAEIDAVRAAGFSEAQIVEIVATVAENFFTNLINNVAGTEVDFPGI
ncbi:carboxymuconolactone decarboxylase family protein [Novosphingobium cyanobacteriorum]|uniref:Carboxymuconolactone decarboxylase family protein n=1 Tax=Novosphingobium cyanobacteriorum TaxID=3024215 RepID=A0ABT6CCQ8_9SPHN|nr:carboxymuconolactone decarboxylase family protein [Novosphingobium cyanobacteriorum]MDF8331721.1 carboxymuconolactone decarboxylase family protein [Novosphingobium cyanobacteriorum]